MPDERRKRIRDFLQIQVNKVLGHRPHDPVDPRRGFMEMGVDSLSAVELRKLLQSGIDQTLSATIIFDYPNVDDLTAYLANEVLSAKSDVDEEEASEKDSSIFDDVFAAIDHLSEDAAQKAILGDD